MTATKTRKPSSRWKTRYNLYSSCCTCSSDLQDHPRL